MADEITEPLFLFCRNRNAGQALLNQMDGDFGYPSPATKTERATSLILHPTENWALIRFAAMPIHSPREKKALDLYSVAMTRLAAKDVELVTTAGGVQPKDPFCRVTETVAKQLGFFAEATTP